jgi:hypothetical protein
VGKGDHLRWRGAAALASVSGRAAGEAAWRDRLDRLTDIRSNDVARAAARIGTISGR